MRGNSKQWRTSGDEMIRQKMGLSLIHILPNTDHDHHDSSFPIEIPFYGTDDCTGLYIVMTV